MDNLEKIKNYIPIYWKNRNKNDWDYSKKLINFTYDDIIDAEKRLLRFSSLIKTIFPEVKDGIIESKLIQSKKIFDKSISNVFFKCDNDLDIAGSVKARGGIYEVLKIAEKLALETGDFNLEDNYAKLNQKKFKELFSKHTILVGSTGNLGISIGMISSNLGFNVEVHMSSEAKEWKKDLLRKNNVKVIEHSSDYVFAVKKAREKSQKKPYSFFIDDENSKELFLGYAVAALRTKKQLENLEININKENPLQIYIPCGVGGAPAGIAFGFKTIYGNNVNCYYIEPTHSPCMLLGISTKKYEKANIFDYNLDNFTQADGLAVAAPSKLTCKMSEHLIKGIYTVEDVDMFKNLYVLKKYENIKVEPSAASSIDGYIKNLDKNGIHICWLTGGRLIPEDLFKKMYEKGEREFLSYH